MIARLERHLIMRRLQEQWSKVVDGAVHIQVIQGDPGIGKTSVLTELQIGLGQRARIVRGHGRVEGRSLLVAADAARPHRLNRSLDPLSAATSLVRSWNRQTRTAPLALLIDDAHALDPASHTAIGVALRKVDGRGLLVVVAGRPGRELQRLADGFDLVELAGLPDENARRVLHENAPHPITESVVARLITLAAGNPLALRSLPGALTREQLAGEHPLPEPMVVGGDLRGLLTRPLRGLSSAARELLDVAMVSVDGDWTTLVSVLGEGSRDAVAELERAGLVTVAGGRVEPFHPLLRDAVRGSLDAPRRRELAARLARSSGLDPTQRLTYRSLAVVGHDEQLATELVNAADLARRRKAHDTAAVLFERAADVAPPGERGAGIRLQASEVLALAGESARARARLAALLDDDAASLPRAQQVSAETLLAALESVGGQPARARARLEELLEHTSATERASVLAALSVPLGMLGDVPALLQTTERALSSSLVAPGPLGALQVVRAHALSAVDEGAGSDLLADVLPNLDVRAAVRADPLFGLHVGRAFGYAERYSEGARLMQALIAGSRRHGARTTLSMAHGALADIRLRSSRLDDALAQLDEAIALSLGAGQRAFAPFWLGMRARIAGYRGDREAAAADLDLGYRIADELGGEGARYYLDAHAGVVAATGQEWGRAAEHLERARYFERAAGGFAPQVARWSIELVEAYAVLDEQDARQEIVDELGRAAARPGARRWTRATAKLASAMVELDRDPVVAAETAAEAASIFHADEDRLDRVRTLGVQLRALTATGAPAAELRSVDAEVRHGLAALRLRPWADRMERELAAMPGGSRHANASSVLTMAEKRVLEELARGLGNQQIAAQLGISVKTVANHLYRIYGKLGVSSRTEATRRHLLGE